MSEQMDKQEPATQFRLDEARKQGKVPRSAETVALASLVPLLIGFVTVAASVGQKIALHSQWWFRNAHKIADSSGGIRYHALRIAGDVLGSLLPVLLAAIAVVVVVSVGHAGFVLSSVPLKPDMARLNPVGGAKRVFSKRSIVELVKLAAKLGVFSALVVSISPSVVQSAIRVMGLSPESMAQTWRSIAVRVSWMTISVFFLFALFDLWFSRREFARQMRMSRRDIKDEHKRREGDPEIKARRRRTQLDLSKRLAGLRNVKNADVILTNPTRVAVALRYRPEEAPLPVTITMGRGVVARSIVLLARRHGVPILRRPPLARALLKDGSPGASIPFDRHAEVASVYRWVLGLPDNKVMAQ